MDRVRNTAAKCIHAELRRRFRVKRRVERVMKRNCRIRFPNFLNPTSASLTRVRIIF